MAGEKSAAGAEGPAVRRTAVLRRSRLSSGTLRGAAVALAMVAGGVVVAERARAQQTQNYDTVKMDVQHVSGGVYMIVGAGGNTTVFTGPEGVMVVDTQVAPLS